MMLNAILKDYTSLETQILECEKLFRPFYHYGAHLCELSEFGSYLTLDVCGICVVLWNDDGVIRAFENACSHRGCKLLKDKEGVHKKIVCPYHGWQFRKGQTIPSSKEFLSMGQDELSLSYYQVEYCGNFIFFSPQPVDTLKDQLGSFFDELAQISMGINGCLDKNTQDFKSNWKISIENALETYHVSDVHKDTLNLLGLTKIDNNQASRNDVMIADVGNKKIHKKLSMIKSSFNVTFNKDKYYSYYLFPFSMLSSTFGLSFSVQNFFPESAQQTNFLSRVYSIESDFPSFYDDVISMNRRIFSEDAEVCELVQSAARSHKKDFIYGLQETRIGMFHAHYLELVQ